MASAGKAGAIRAESEGSCAPGLSPNSLTVQCEHSGFSCASRLWFRCVGGKREREREELLGEPPTPQTRCLVSTSWELRGDCIKKESLITLPKVSKSRLGTGVPNDVCEQNRNAHQRHKEEPETQVATGKVSGRELRLWGTWLVTVCGQPWAQGRDLGETFGRHHRFLKWVSPE